jgi:HD-GYP domain-containing protein (c-di-GMP phosphodiesterase class II)
MNEENNLNLSKPSTLKKFFTVWRPSLGRRLTFSFTLFGLVIGYAVFIYLAISSTNTFIKLVSDSTRQYIAAFSGGSNAVTQSELLKIINQGLTNIVSASEPLRGLFPSLKTDLYFQDGGNWQHTYMDTQGKTQSGIITDKKIAGSLEDAKISRLITSSKFFYGAGDTVNVKINISPLAQSSTQILSFNIHRLGFIKMVRENLYKAIVFFAILLFISHTLAQLFSIWLARPIEKLSQEAEAIAAGEYERRFTMGRKDEIGILAQSLNTMASRILDGTRERENILIGILIALTRAIDAKSPWTAGHSERVTKFAEDIGRGLNLSQDQIRNLNISAILHDIGKIAVPEQVLDKPGKLTDEEFEIVKTHPRAGANIISSIPSYETILPGILHHHERWDGTGYPAGVKGQDIPLFARIICVADVYDALSEDRPYRKAWGEEQILKFFEDQKEKMFDPELVDIFLKHIRG